MSARRVSVRDPTPVVPASIPMVNVVGPHDEFLAILERDLAADVHVRGNEVTLPAPRAT